MEIISPRKSDEGIVFYVSADGTKTGISISGLERLLGFVAASNLFTKNQLLSAMADGTLREDIPKTLEITWGKVFSPDVKGSDGAKIVMEDAAVAIIEYYAFERNNETAKRSFRNFAKRGFPAWVKEVTHFATEPIAFNDQLREALREILDEKLEAVMGKASRWDNLEGITATVYPGMKALNDGLSQSDRQKLLVSTDLYTAVDWLTLKKIVVDKSTKHAFCRQAADTYLTMTGQRPPDKYELKETASGMRSVKVGKGYKTIDFHVLETAWDSYSQHKDEQASKPKGKRGRPRKTA